MKLEASLGIFPFHYGKKSRKEVAINAVSIPFGSIQSDVEFYSGVVCLLVLLSFSSKVNLTSKYSGFGKEFQSGLYMI